MSLWLQVQTDSISAVVLVDLASDMSARDEEISATSRSWGRRRGFNSDNMPGAVWVCSPARDRAERGGSVGRKDRVVRI